MERSFFDQVLDAFEGFAADVDGTMHTYAHSRGLKVWYDEANREHYEAQLVRISTVKRLEIGFHVEYPKVDQNDQVITRLLGAEVVWRAELGDGPQVGGFIGNDTWRRVSEVWDPPDPDDIDAAIEVAATLADYVRAIEPIRRSTRS